MIILSVLFLSLARADEGEVARRLAWVEGDIQSSYQSDRKYARERLKSFEGREPSPEDLDRYLEYLALLDITDHPEAVKKMKSFIVARPSDKRAAFLMGVHFLRRGKKDFAKYLFTQLEADKEFPWKSFVLNNLGMLALDDKNADQAVHFFEKAAKAIPRTAAPLVNLGALYLKSQSYKDALPLFKEARRLDPDFEDAALGFGASLEGVGKYADAHEVYTEYLEAHPEAISTLYNDSIVLGNFLKQRDKAAELMLRYIQKGGKETARAHEIIRSWR
ncbi:MAG: tetratricopeptide repeat protein [Deltaproteobacteria bacterium]|nr:tetratricopeptide repeat protein [Deltaproteobacteria bacterium]